MELQQTTQIAKHLRTTFFGGNWTSVNLKETLDGISWQQAAAVKQNVHSIAALVFHINYYLEAISSVLTGGELMSHDKYSFDHPPIDSEMVWEKLTGKALANAEKVATLIGQLPDSILGRTFVAEKYGTYFSNFWGLIEHTHYHLGQIVILKKLHSSA